MSQNKERKGIGSESDFVQSFSEFNTLPEEISQEQVCGLSAVGAGIRNELETSQRRFFAIYGMASIVGYFLSLSVCSQNSIAFTTFSLDIASYLHQLPDPLCPLVCGWVFSMIPTLCLLLALDRFQRRRLVSQFWWLPPLTTIGFCVLMILLPSYLQHEGMHAMHAGIRTTHTDIFWLMWWMLASVSIPAIASAWARSRVRAADPVN